MFKLIENELTKLFAKKKIYIFMGIILTMSLIPTLVYKYGQVDRQMVAQKLPLEYLVMNMEMLFLIFSAIIISDIFTDEYRQGTLKLSLVHPVQRKSLFQAKIYVIAIALIILLLFSMVVSYILGFVFFTWGGGLVVNQVTYSGLIGVLVTFSSHLLAVLPILAFSLLIVIISLYLSSGGAVVGASVGLIFAFNILGQLSAKIRPLLITNYLKFPFLIFGGSAYEEIIYSIVAISLYGIISYVVALRYFINQDIIY